MENFSLHPVKVETFTSSRWGERYQAGRRRCSCGVEWTGIQEVKIVAISCSFSDSALVLPAAGVCRSLICAHTTTTEPVPSLPGTSELLPQAAADGLLPRDP